VRAARVVGRNPDGTEQLVRLDATCVTRGTADNHYGGQVIAVPSVATVQRSGATGIGSVPALVSADTLWIESLDPSDLRPGQSYSITVTGRGFDDRVRIEFLLPFEADGQTINPDITIDTLTVWDSETVMLEVTVSSDARLYPAGAPISYGRLP
jgi:hypothetical protein